jgi:DNA anti-recombination protein RmuC
MFSDLMKSLTEDIETAYETRKAAVSALATETRQSLGKFQRERAKMARDLRRSLASNKVQRAKQVQRMRAAHNTGFHEMSKAMATFLSAAETTRKQEFATLIGEIQDGIAALEHDMTSMLADFHSEREGMTSALQADLTSETRERAEQTRTLLSRFTGEHQKMADTLGSELSSFQRDLSQSVAEMIGNFSADHRQARAHWHDLATTMSAKRTG